MPDQTPDQQTLVDAFNHAHHHIGYPVRYWTGDREGDGKISTTRTEAQLLGGHTAVVWVEGVASCIALTHVEPLPDQPAETCGEVGISFTTDHEPRYTDPCPLPPGHDELHDWARREAAGEPSPAETADRLAAVTRERDQLRYERRLLGAARLVLDRVANSGRLAPSGMEKLRNEAAIVAQRIVDEIGHPVTDEPALGPELRAELAKVTEQRDAAHTVIERLRNELLDATVPSRAQDAEAAGYAEAVARLRDDERYRNWWTARAGAPGSYPVYWDGPGRTHLADYLETVGPDGIDVTTGIGVRTAGRELLDVLQAFALPFEVNRAAYRLRLALGGVPAGESQASEPARRPLSPASAVAVEVIAELARAEAKFPDQHLPDGTGPDVVWGITGPASWAADQARTLCQQKAEDGFLTWLDVLREEVSEGFAESEWAKLRPELVQVAAMAVRWVLDGDSRSAVTA